MKTFCCHDSPSGTPAHHVPFPRFHLLYGEDLRQLPLLLARKALRSAHTRGNGTALYWLACQLDRGRDLAKRADSRYEDTPNVRNWIKTKHPAYSQKERRGTCLSERGRCTYHTDLRREQDETDILLYSR
jgi:hypothetical protein